MVEGRMNASKKVKCGIARTLFEIWACLLLLLLLNIFSSYAYADSLSAGSSLGYGGGSTSSTYDVQTLQEDDQAFETTKVRTFGIYHYEAAQSLLGKINSYRSQNGIAPLKLDINLTEACMLRAVEVTVMSDYIRPNGKPIDSAFPSRYVCGPYEDIPYSFALWLWATNDVKNDLSGQKVFEAWSQDMVWDTLLLDAGWSKKSIGIGCFSQGGSIAWYVFVSGEQPEGSVPDKAVQVNPTIDLSWEVCGSQRFLDYKGQTDLYSQLTLLKGNSINLSCCIPAFDPVNDASSLSLAIDPSFLAWSSSNTGVCTVSADGLIKAVGAGNCTISAKMPSGETTSREIFVKDSKNASISKALTTIQFGKPFTSTGDSAAKVKGGTTIMVDTQSGIKATKYPVVGATTAFKVTPAKGFAVKAFNVTYTDTAGKQIKLTNGNGLTRVGAYSPTANTYEFTVPDAKDISVNVTFEFTAKTTEISKALIHPDGTTSASSCAAGTVEMVATQSGIAATKYPKVGGRTAFKVTTKKGYKVSAFNVTYTDAAGKQIKLTNGNGLNRVGKYSTSSNTYEFDVPASNDVKVNVTYTR